MKAPAFMPTPPPVATDARTIVLGMEKPQSVPSITMRTRWRASGDTPCQYSQSRRAPKKIPATPRYVMFV